MLKSQSFSYTLGLSCNAHAYGMYLQAHTCTEQRVGSTLILSPIRNKGERGFLLKLFLLKLPNAYLQHLF